METYIVKTGDSLWLIAKKYGISLQSLIAANSNISDPDTINVGDVVNVPISNSGTSQPNTTSYTVAAGDTLWLISKNFGITLTDLINANSQISDPNKIDIGQKINIPQKNNGYSGDPHYPYSKKWSGHIKPHIPHVSPPQFTQIQPLQPMPPILPLPTLGPLPVIPPPHYLPPCGPMQMMPYPVTEIYPVPYVEQTFPSEIRVYHTHYICGCCAYEHHMGM